MNLDICLPATRFCNSARWHRTCFPGFSDLAALGVPGLEGNYWNEENILMMAAFMAASDPWGQSLSLNQPPKSSQQHKLKVAIEESWVIWTYAIFLESFGNFSAGELWLS